MDSSRTLGIAAAAAVAGVALLSTRLLRGGTSVPPVGVADETLAELERLRKENVSLPD
jgi:hypothetical protein